MKTPSNPGNADGRLGTYLCRLNNEWTLDIFVRSKDTRGQYEFVFGTLQKVFHRLCLPHLNRLPRRYPCVCQDGRTGLGENFDAELLRGNCENGRMSYCVHPRLERKQNKIAHITLTTPTYQTAPSYSVSSSWHTELEQ